MSGSNTTSSGTPISALPLASSVAATDTMLGIVGSGTTSGGNAKQVSIATLGAAISTAAGIPDAVSSATQAATQADAAAKKAYAAGGQAVQDQAGVSGGVAQLDKQAQLYLQGQSALGVTPATSATVAMLSPLLPLHPGTQLGPGGQTLTTLMDRAEQIPAGTYIIDHSNAVLQVPAAGELPADVTLNGDIYIAGTLPLPAGLSADPVTGIILTDGTAYYPNTTNNGGVLCAAAE